MSTGSHMTRTAIKGWIKAGKNTRTLGQLESLRDKMSTIQELLSEEGISEMEDNSLIGGRTQRIYRTAQSLLRILNMIIKEKQKC